MKCAFAKITPLCAEKRSGATCTGSSAFAAAAEPKAPAAIPAATSGPAMKRATFLFISVLQFSFGFVGIVVSALTTVWGVKFHDRSYGSAGVVARLCALPAQRAIPRLLRIELTLRGGAPQRKV